MHEHELHTLLYTTDGPRARQRELCFLTVLRCSRGKSTKVGATVRAVFHSTDTHPTVHKLTNIRNKLNNVIYSLSIKNKVVISKKEEYNQQNCIL